MNWLKELRTKLGCTQKNIADLCNISKSYVSMIETERREPPLGITPKLFALLKQLDIPANSCAANESKAETARKAKRNRQILYGIKKYGLSGEIATYKVKCLREKKAKKEALLAIIERVLSGYPVDPKTEVDPKQLVYCRRATNRNNFHLDEIDLCLMELKADVYKYKAGKLAELAEKFALKEGNGR